MSVRHTKNQAHGSGRRVPSQKRSKERYDLILETAEAAMVRDGVGALNMQVIARESNVPIGSLYQYFGNLEDVLIAIADRYHLQFKDLISSSFEDVNTIQEFSATLIASIRKTFSIVEQSPAYAELWFGAQTWGAFRALDWEDTFRNASVMTDVLTRLLPELDRSRVETAMVVFLDAAGSIARMALQFPDRRDELLNQYDRMMLDHLSALTRRAILDSSFE